MDSSLEHQDQSTPNNNENNNDNIASEKALKEVITRTLEVEISIKYLIQVVDTTYADGSTQQAHQYSKHFGFTSNRDDLTESY
jgi:hypothetical protein